MCVDCVRTISIIRVYKHDDSLRRHRGMALADATFIFVCLGIQNLLGLLSLSLISAFAGKFLKIYTSLTSQMQDSLFLKAYDILILYQNQVAPSCVETLREKPFVKLAKLELLPKFRKIRYTDEHIYRFSFCPGILFKAAQAVVPEFRDQFQLSQFRIFTEGFYAAWRLPAPSLYYQI